MNQHNIPSGFQCIKVKSGKKMILSQTSGRIRPASKKYNQFCYSRCYTGNEST